MGQRNQPRGLFVMLIAATAAALLSTSARAALLLYEPFDYSSGSALAGQGGSEIGFDAGSTWAYSGGHTVDIASGSIAFGDLYTSGNRGTATSTAALNEITAATRAIDFSVDSGSVWLSWLTQTDVGDTLTGRGVSINSAANAQDFAAFSKRNNDSGPGVVKYGGSSANTGAGLPASTPFLILAKFDGVGSASGRATMWMVSESEFASMTAGGGSVSEAKLNAAVAAGRIASLSITGAPTISADGRIAVNTVDTSNTAYESFQFDELRIGTDATDVAPVRQALALYSFALPATSTFSGPQFASSDTESHSVAANLTNHGFNGGGANSFIIDNTAFNSSDSGSPGLNLGNANQTSASNYISFTVTPDAGVSLAYDKLTLFAETYYAGDSFNLELRVVDGNGAEQTLASMIVPGAATQNSSVLPITLDFADFISSDVTQWRLYAWNTQSDIAGVRLDDIALIGAAVSVPAPSALPAGLLLMVLAGLPMRRGGRAAL